MSRGLAFTPLSRTPSREGVCQSETCRHTRASHGARGRRCWATGCSCPGWLAPDVAP